MLERSHMLPKKRSTISPSSYPLGQSPDFACRDHAAFLHRESSVCRMTDQKGQEQSSPLVHQELGDFCRRREEYLFFAERCIDFHERSGGFVYLLKVFTLLDSWSNGDVVLFF